MTAEMEMSQDTRRQSADNLGHSPDEQPTATLEMAESPVGQPVVGEPEAPVEASPFEQAPGKATFEKMPEAAAVIEAPVEEPPEATAMPAEIAAAPAQMPWWQRILRWSPGAAPTVKTVEAPQVAPEEAQSPVALKKVAAEVRATPDVEAVLLPRIAVIRQSLPVGGGLVGG